jgi:hypothetical protein
VLHLVLHSPEILRAKCYFHKQLAFNAKRKIPVLRRFDVTQGLSFGADDGNRTHSVHRI